MTKHRLFLFAYVLCFTLTFLGCRYMNQPLVFKEVVNTEELLKFALLIAALTASLVYVSLPLMKWLKTKFNIHSEATSYYVVSILLFLQLVTLLAGYAESKLSHGEGEWLYYYRGITNSQIYIGTGNLTALFIAYFYGQAEQGKTHRESDIVDAGHLL